MRQVTPSSTGKHPVWKHILNFHLNMAQRSGSKTPVNYVTPHKPLTNPSLSFHIWKTTCSSWLLDFLYWLVPQLLHSSVLPSATAVYSKPSIKFVSYLLPWLEWENALSLICPGFFCCWIILLCVFSQWSPIPLSLDSLQSLQNISARGQPLTQVPQVNHVVLLSMPSQNENTLVMGTVDVILKLSY